MSDKHSGSKEVCQKHENHAHRHGPDCGHKTVQHGDHVDYVHDGHYHRVHGDHVDECAGPKQ
jgi:hypothetical protein